MPGQEYNVPFDLTQDGIAMVVGITRSHASLDLKKLGDTGMVTNWQAHQKGAKSRRLVYTITQAGLDKAGKTRIKLEEEGIDADILLDMRKCDPETKWNALSEKDRETFGKACVLRVGIPRESLPETPTGTLPTDIFGMVRIPPEVSKRYLEKIHPDDIRKWNSWAADWWLENDNVQERLHHLVEAGRDMEAEKLAVRHRDELLDNPNEDLLRILCTMSCSDSKYEDILWMRSQTALACRNMEELKRCSKEYSKLHSPVGNLVDAQICILRENYEDAYDLAADAYDSLHNPASVIVMAQACIHMNDLQTADELTVEACEAMHRIGDAKDIDSILSTRAEIAYRLGDRTAAYALLGKAKASAPEFKKKHLQELMDLVNTPGIRVNFD